MTTWIKDEGTPETGKAIKYTLEPFHRNIPESMLFENLADMWEALGRQPKFRDCYRGLSKYSAATYAERFGSWRSALERFVVWSMENDRNLTVRAEPFKKHTTPRSVNLRLRAEILMRDYSTCQLCGASPIDGAKLEVDHIVPWSAGGETVAENLQTLCTVCNNGKNDSQFYVDNKEAIADMKRLAEEEKAKVG